jgi:hypothetical protein
MAEYRKAPKAPLGKRIVDGVRNHLGASIASFVVGVAVLVFGILFLGQGGSESGSSTTVIRGSGRQATRTEREEKPKDAVEEAAQRPFWIAPPTTYESAEKYEGEVAALSYLRTDLLVGFPKEIYEQPEPFVGKPFYIVGRVVSQTPLPHSFYGRELRLVSGEPGYDAYVGATAYLTDVRDGDIVLARGRLAAAGETQQPGGGPAFRSIYFLATFEGNGGDVEDDILAPSSGTLRAAIKRVTQATQ